MVSPRAVVEALTLRMPFKSHDPRAPNATLSHEPPAQPEAALPPLAPRQRHAGRPAAVAGRASPATLIRSSAPLPS